MDTDRRYMTMDQKQRTLLLTVMLEASRLAFSCPGSLRPSFHRADCKVPSGTCTHTEFYYRKETLRLAYQDLIYRTIACLCFAPVGRHYLYLPWLSTIQISSNGWTEMSLLTRYMEIREAYGKLSPNNYWLNSY